MLCCLNSSKPMRVFLLAVIAPTLLVQTGCATPFGKRQSGQFGSYKERQIAEKIWEIKAEIKSPGYQDAIQDIAVYRASEIGASRGYHFMVLLNGTDVTNREQFQLGPRSTENSRKIVIKVRYINDWAKGPYLAPDCELPKRLVCQTISLESMMRSIGPRLKEMGWKAVPGR